MPLDLKHYKNRHSLKSKVLRVIWNVTWLLLFRPTPRGNLFRPWRAFLLRCFGAKLAKGANVLPSCRIWQPWKLEMGAYSCLSERVDCYNADWIRLGDQVTVSQDAFLCTASHDISSPIMELTTAPLTLGNQCWVCARAVLLPGVTLGEGAVVAASAVVTKDVPAWTVVGGNPANKITLRELAPPPHFGISTIPLARFTNAFGHFSQVRGRVLSSFWPYVAYATRGLGIFMRRALAPQSYPVVHP